MQVLMLFLGTIIFVIGVKIVYDARLIVNKYFSVIDKNKSIIILKVLGTICAVIGIIIVSKNWNAL